MGSLLRQCFFRINPTTRLVVNCARFYQTSLPLLSQAKPPKRSNTEVIRLYNENGKSIGTKTKSDAEALAKKNGFLLVAMPIMGKPKFPEYKFLDKHKAGTEDADESQNTNEDPFENLNEDVENEDEIKEPQIKNGPAKDTSSKNKNKQQTVQVIKRLTLDVRISDGDLFNKVGQVNKWIAKNSVIHIVIVKGNPKQLEEICQKMKEKLVSGHRVLNKKVKGTTLKMIIDKDPNQLTPDFDEIKKQSEAWKKTSEFQIDSNLDLLNNEEVEKVLEEVAKKSGIKTKPKVPKELSDLL